MSETSEEPEPQPPGQKVLLVINTGSPKKRFIFQKLNKIGHKIVVANKDKGWASAYVDDWILVDTANHAETINQVGKYLQSHQVDGVITFWEDDVLLVSKIVDKFGLTGISYDVAKVARNKLLFRTFCEQRGLPAPRHRLVNTSDEVEQVMRQLTFPVVIKPAYGSSSAYVIKANDLTELLSAFKYIKDSLSVNTESALQDGNDIFIEEYIDGDEVDIDIIVQNGRVKFASVADNYRTSEPFFIETTHALPSNLPIESQTALIQMAEEILERLGVQFGCIHFEAKITKTGPVPLEVNLRMGGDEIYISSKKVWGVDLIELAVKVALNEYIKKYQSLKPKKYVMTQSLHAPDSGMVSSLHIDKAILDQAQVEQYYVGKDVGDPILVPPEGYEYLGWVTVSGDNFLDTQDNLQTAVKAIEYEIVKFDEGSVLGKTSRRNRFSAASLRKSLVLSASKIEHLRSISKTDQRKLRIGVACNSYTPDAGSVEAELSSVGRTIEQTLQHRGYDTTFIDFNNLPQAVEILKKGKIDFIFNVCERINNSSLLEPHAASLFDAFQIPYTGSNPYTLASCIDKIRVKKLLTYHNIPTAKWDYVYSLDDEIDEELSFPLMVKPANTDNSIGITNDSVVTNKTELQQQLAKVINELKVPALIEEYIEGDEYDVSILGSEEDDLMVLPLARTIFDKLPADHWHIYPFESKFGDNSFVDKYLTIQQPPKGVSSKLTSLITEIALDTYNILDCHDYGRVEIKVDRDNNPYVLELNPNPSINRGNRVPEVASLVGMDYGDFLEKIIALAIKRYQNRPPYYHLQTNMI